MQITINSPSTGTAKDAEGKTIPRSATVEYNFGADLKEAVELFGAPVVFSKFQAQASTDLGNSCRRILNDPKNGEADCAAFAAKWKPGVVTKGERKKAVSVPALVAKLKDPATPQEEKLEIAAKLQAYLEAKNEEEKLIKGTLKSIQ